MIKAKLIKELNEVLSGEPWYGSSVLKLLKKVDPDKSHYKSHGSHSSADILKHMIAWTDETAERLKGKFASDPAMGDWPDPSGQTWEVLVEMFVKSNKQLNETIVEMQEDVFGLAVNDARNPPNGESCTVKELIEGIIQHHIYHSAQIAILTKEK